MTTKLRVQRFRTRRPDPVTAPAPVPRATKAHRIGDDAFFPNQDDDGFAGMTFPTAKAATPAADHRAEPAANTAPHDIDTIRQEGLTGRQLRMARRLAQKHDLPATSDFDAVRLLRNAGIDPFQANSVLELVSSAGSPPNQPPGSRALTITPGGDGIQLPQTIKPAQLPSTEQRAEQAHIAEVARIQRDIAARRRKKSLLLMARLFVFVMLPTFMAGIYYYTVATPFYETHAEFVIQSADAAASPLGGLLKSSPMGSSQDSIAVQGYLQSQDAMTRLDADHGFRTHYSDPAIDPLQRLSPDASNTAAYKTYRRYVKISYDPTEGLIKMDVIAADPQVAVNIAKALIGYAEEQVDQLTSRLRTDQMQGAQESYQKAEAELKAANERVLALQKQNRVISSEVEVGLITGQITQLDSQLTLERLSLAQMESNQTPNVARMDPVKRRIATLEEQIATLRAKLTEDDANGQSLAAVQSELLVAQADAQTRQLLLAQSLQAMESARTQANRQTRYLSMSAPPIAADEATYPRAFENTLVVMLIFAGIYLMISMTIAILREQVTA
ncbi:MAG: capsule biosynthesis protein [Cypionkella sp.]|uniref:capsule biosynthesis protein n=1 Tax=Cypionkella sp. TaxID=2811411 RepID=UPI002728902A|nr:capsule biosynthesis protein [Cypionkella sp.]MDO8326361.1 capsule biosynthesis protein [Cypionkella sp.]